jgi:hypothetical protein
MLVTAEYPFLSVFGTMILFFAWALWFWMMIGILSDVFRRHDLSGWAKAGWAVFLLVLPFVGALIYLVRNAAGLAERREGPAAATRAPRDGAGTAELNGGSAGEIERAKQLLDAGAITQSEFERLKAKALA